MKCYLPFVERMGPASERFARIAALMGADCAPISVSGGSSEPVRDLELPMTEKGACIALCPEVMKAWLKGGEIPSSLASFIKAHCQFVLIHELDADEASDHLLRAFSAGVLQVVRKLENLAGPYCVKTTELCGEFSGLEFGASDPSDRILTGESTSPLVEPIVTVGADPIFARVTADPCEVFFIGGVASGKVDFDIDLSDENFAAYFREIVPLVMFLRHAFRDECWRPANPPGATLIIDDPPLWKRYGFLNYAKLMTMMDQFNFHTCIAFIPYYWKKTAASTVQRFRDRPDRLSLCYHGNDHTSSEFASEEARSLDAMLATATSRMESFTERTGIPCSRIIVFPQGRFSRAAMRALQEHDFAAAVNSHHFPRGEQMALTLADLLQPALLSFNGFPLFLRKYVRETTPERIAWNAFFGRPLLIVEHHEIFQDPSPLLALVSTINKILPNVQWGNLETVVENACLKRIETDRSLRIRAFAPAVRVQNPGQAPLRCVPEWPSPGSGRDVKSVPSTGNPALNWKLGEAFEVAPFAVGRSALPWKSVPRNLSPLKSSFKKQIKIHLRRRLSEFRDNYMSRSKVTMSLVNSVRQLMR